MDKENSLTRGEEEDEDPVEFLLQNKEYHDWTVTVKDPSTGTQKDFGVSSQNLVAHSKVFRTSMSDPKWVKEKKLVIPNMSHQTFDLIYRFVNAGDLGLQKISQEDVADLVIAADMYMLPRLVKKACKYLIPASVEDIFPALTVVSFIPNTDLETHVSKLVQLNTEEIMVSIKFLRLDRQCIEFIVKQEVLSLPEIEVWKHLVNWANHQVGDDGKKTLRLVLGSALKHVRFCTLTHEDIVKEVAPNNVLTAEELSSLLCAVIGKQPWNQPELCGSQTERQHKETNPNKTVILIKPVGAKSRVFKTLGSYVDCERILTSSQENNSHFTIETKKNIQLQYLTFKPKALLEKGASRFYSMSCLIEVKKRLEGSFVFLCKIEKITKDIFGGDDEFSVPAINSSSNQLLELEANNKYHFNIILNPFHLARELGYQSGRGDVYTTQGLRTVSDVMTVQHHSPIHVEKILYTVLS